MKYYIVQIMEDHEVYVKKSVERIFPWISVIIPVKSETVLVDNRKVLTFNRTFEEYVILCASKDITSIIKELERVSGVVSVLKDGNSPSEISEEESKKYTEEIDKNDIDKLKSGIINITNGPSAGRRGKLIRIKLPSIRIGVINHFNDRRATTVTVPIWHVVKLLEES